MKEYLIKVPDELAAKVMESLAGYSGVQVEEFEDAEEEYTPQSKEEILEGIREAVEEMNEITAGRKKALSMEELFDGL